MKYTKHSRDERKKRRLLRKQITHQKQTTVRETAMSLAKSTGSNLLQRYAIDKIYKYFNLEERIDWLISSVWNLLW